MRKLLILLVVASIPAFSGMIEDLGLFNTGATGWVIGSTPAVVVTAPVPGDPGLLQAWLANTPASSWISSQADVTAMTEPADATYDYKTTFTINPAQYVPSTIAITGRWAVDNAGELKVNGSSTVLASIASKAPDSFNQWYSFSIPSGSFASGGAQTLHFAVTNTGIAGFNPHGLRVEFTEATGVAVPEPGTLALLGGGLLALGLIRRRRS